MKEDLRVTKTKDNIKHGMLNLLSKYTFKEITIGMLMDECRINKTTFYRHYLDKYDLMEKIADDYLSLFKIVSVQFQNGINEINVKSLLQFFEDHKRELLILESKILPINLFDDIYETTAQDICVYFKKSIKNQELISLYAHLISNNILLTIKWYHKKSPELTKDNVVKIVMETIEKGFEQTIACMAK